MITNHLIIGDKPNVVFTAKGNGTVHSIIFCNLTDRDDIHVDYFIYPSGSKAEEKTTIGKNVPVYPDNSGLAINVGLKVENGDEIAVFCPDASAMSVLVNFQIG